MGAEARLSCVHVQLGLEGKKKNKRWCTYPSSPASWAPLASATLCVSGQSSLTVGSAGLCGGLFILERGLPSGSLHLSKHPPRPLLCVPGLTQPPHPTPSPTGCSASHPLSCFITPSSHCPIFSSTFLLFLVPCLSFSSPPWTAFFFLSRFLQAHSPSIPSSRGREKKQRGVD